MVQKRIYKQYSREYKEEAIALENNPGDKDLFLPVLDTHVKNYNKLPTLSG